MNKGLIALLLLAAPVLAQRPAQEPAKNQAEVALNRAGCGPSGASFDVAADKNQHPLAHPDAGKALVYVINWVDTTTRVGIDGSWVGADRYKSYFSFSVDPGDHHLCLNEQTDGVRGSAASFQAAAGHEYYFFLSPREEGARWKLESVDPARGMFLIAGSGFSTSHAKK